MAEKNVTKTEDPKPPTITVPSTTELVAEPETVVEPDQPKEGKQMHFAESSAFTRSRWETPDGSPSGALQNQGLDTDLSKDEIFDRWDDDKLREYLLKSKGQKVRKEAKKMMDSAEQEKQAGKKKKKRSKPSVDSPPKESPKKEKSAKRRSSSHDSSSSSSWSPIHKAPQPEKKPDPPRGGQEKYLPPDYDEEDNQSVDMQESSPPDQDMNYKHAASKKDSEATAVQYPFSHIQSSNPFPAPPSAPIAPSLPPTYATPGPVPPPAPTLPSLGEMQVLGPDGTPMRLVPTSIPGPDGKIIQVMQIQPVVAMAPTPPPQTIPAAPPNPPAPVQAPTPSYPRRVPPPPPTTYPPPVSQTPQMNTGMFMPMKPTNTTESPVLPPQQPVFPDKTAKNLTSQTFQSKNADDEIEITPPPEKSSKEGDEFPFTTNDHASNLKRMELSQKQSKKPEVLKTRFKPRPAGSWADEVKVTKKEKTPEEPKFSEPKNTDSSPIPNLVDKSGKSKMPTFEEQKIATITTDRSVKTGFDSRHINLSQRSKNDWNPDPIFDEKPSFPPSQSQTFGPAGGGPQFPQISKGQTGKAKHEEKDKKPEPKIERSFRQRDLDSSNDEAEAKEERKKRKPSSADDSGDDEFVKRKKDKKKKKKNKKKKEDSDGQKEKKKKKKQKEKSVEKSGVVSLEYETIKSKKDLKAFEEMNKKSKKDALKRDVDQNLPLSYTRGMIHLSKDETDQILFRHVVTEDLASSSSYEDHFVSLFSSSDPEPGENKEKIDLTKKSVQKFRVSVPAPRSVSHITKVSLYQRIKHQKDGTEIDEEAAPQRVSLNTSNLPGGSKRSVSRSRSRSYSSSASSETPKKPKKKHKARSRSSSRSSSRSRSRSVSLPAAYGGEEDKQGKRKRRSSARDETSRDQYSRSRSRSRSSSGDDRDRGRRRQMYYNRNNQGYYYNNRGRGYYQNRNRGWYNNNNRGNFRGRWNWNNQGWNRNQNWRNQRYDRRDRYSRDQSRSRSRDRSDRSSSRERDREKDDRRDSRDKSPRTRSPANRRTSEETKTAPDATQKVANDNTTTNIAKPSTGYDMFDDDVKPPGED